MKKIISILILIASFAVAHVYANEMDFTVKPILDSGQTLSESTISSKYETGKVLTFELKNESDEPINILIKTSYPGLDTHGNQTFSSSESFLKAPKTVALAAKQSKKITITFDADTFKSDFDGEISNAILFIQDDIGYYFEYMINVRKNDNKATEKLQLVKSEPTNIDGKRAVRITLKNASNAWLKDVKITSKTLGMDGGKTENHDFSKIAPNSKIEILLPLGKSFQVGRYLTDITAKTADKSWHFKANFVLTQTQVDKLNGLKKLPDTGRNAWFLRAISGLVTLLALGIGVQLWLINRKSSCNK
ncbi:WxL protein host-binding domain-containing protein [Lactococcus insecticola]|uniref:Cell surface protein n=1 Tax=Pseudolactococcus insecticola TaxID=2709158 RepID=A0A6A0B545_9LACT|nr:DUF3324 domain-containing protein [Lactococcus insecticola]GFH40500.1 cell surface protein [Lactococcus insecticola]